MSKSFYWENDVKIYLDKGKLGQKEWQNDKCKYWFLTLGNAFH